MTSGGRSRGLAVALLGLVLGAAPAGAADEVGEAFEASLAAQRAARESQNRVDKLDDEARALRDKQRNAQWQALRLAAYADELEQEAQAEEQKRDKLEAELARIASTGTDLLPLLRRMVAELEAFIAADLPFQQALRRQRVADLKTVLDDSQRGNAEKFRRVIDAYRAEVDYGHSIGAEDVEMECAGARGAAVLVHVGRVGLYCLGADGSAGHWDAARKAWQALEDAGEVRKAIAIARNEMPAELLVLPVPVARRVP